MCHPLGRLSQLSHRGAGCEGVPPSLPRLEQDIKKLKADLQASRQVEQELRSQVSSLSSAERGSRAEMGQLRQENELLQNKYVGTGMARVNGEMGVRQGVWRDGERMWG